MGQSVLSSAQKNQIKQRATDAWRDDSDLERRRRVGTELRQAIERAGVLQGKNIDHRQLCELVGLQWQIQNLNPMQMPKFLGLFAYKVHFGGFQGTREDLLAQRKEETGKGVMYDGADLNVVSEAIRLMTSDVAEDQASGAATLLAVPGAGQALVSGFLHLLHPDKYGLVNAPTKAPFIKDAWLKVTEQQRRQAREVAKAWFSNASELKGNVFKLVFRWEAFLRDVYETCGFADYHELDQFLWALTTEPEGDADVRLAAAVKDIRPEDLAARKEAETKARQLVEDNLGQLTSEQYTELFTLLNTGHGKRGVVYTRFSPAFVGHNANQLIEQGEELNGWIEKLWTANDEEVPKVLSRFWEVKLAGSGRSLPTAILYLRDKEKYAVWTTKLEKALYSVIQGLPTKLRTGFSYLQYCKGVHQLRKKASFPPEMHDYILFKLIQTPKKTLVETKGAFTGFTRDAFDFMAELIQNNNNSWFDENRQRFKDSVDGPLRALVKDLGQDVITPLDPGLETSPKSNKCIARIRKNVWGKGEENAYQELYWAAFYRKELNKNTDCQLFISIRPGWFQHGIFFGEQADPVREQLNQALKQSPDLGRAIFDRLSTAGFLIAPGDSNSVPEPIDVQSYEAFANLVKEDRFHVYRRMVPDEAVAAGTNLKKTIGDDFRTLYPLFRMATSEQSQTDIWKLLEEDKPDDDDEDTVITTGDLAANTFLEEQFFEMLDLYLKDKRQLIFCGPPGTGKTYIALEYAEYLAQGGGEVKTVQFHPSYGYEDFIEGLRPVPSKSGLSYQVEDGIFKKLCDAARTNSKARYVLIIDEINRGNIPRIFGELLFLLERREKTTELPCSKKPFSIPHNVIVLGTMNSSDRSIALMDLALRRRFHFVEMQPRAEVLLGWLQQNGKPRYVRDLFVRLNKALHKAGIDEDRFIGHAHFMSPHLDDEFLKLIWTGTIEPLLKEYFFAEPEKLADFRLEKFQDVIEESAIDESSEEDDEAEDDTADDEAQP